MVPTIRDADNWTDDNRATATGPVSVYGASDDLIELEGGVDEEIGAYEKPVEIEFGDTTRGTRLIVEYAPGDAAAVWRIAVEPINEDVPMFACRVPGLGGRGGVTWVDGVRADGLGYSPLLVVECPPKTPVRWRKIRG